MTTNITRLMMESASDIGRGRLTSSTSAPTGDGHMAGAFVGFDVARRGAAFEAEIGIGPLLCLQLLAWSRCDGMSAEVRV